MGAKAVIMDLVCESTPRKFFLLTYKPCALYVKIQSEIIL